MKEFKPRRVRFVKDWTYRELTFSRRFKENQEETLPRAQLEAAKAANAVEVLPAKVSDALAEDVESAHVALSNLDTTFHKPVQDSAPELIAKSDETSAEGE